MNREQQRAIDVDESITNELLQTHLEGFLDYMQQKVEAVPSTLEFLRQFTALQSSNNDKHASYWISWLKSKDIGFTWLIRYLKEINNSNLALELEKTITQAFDSFTQKKAIPLIEQFIYKVTKFCKIASPFFQTLSGTSIDVNLAWIPTRFKSIRDSTTLSYLQLLVEIKDGGKKTILIKGHRGVGKSFLVKKIVYEWAQKKALGDFALVLAAPVAKLRPDESILRAVVNYYLDNINMDLDDHERDDLVDAVRELGPKLLLCFDSTEDYQGIHEELFGSLKILGDDGNKFLITFFDKKNDRIEKLADDLHPLKLEILLINESNIKNFVSNYYDSNSVGVKQRVIDFLDQSCIPATFPLFLSYTCYLAQLTPDILYNLTSVYCSFIRQILTQEQQSKKLKCHLDIHTWKESKVIVTTSALAFYGSERGKRVFNESEIKRFSITDDSFICGFLVRYSGSQNAIEFRHQSFQDFFTAINCLFLTEGERSDKLTARALTLCRNDTRTGRFYFGIVSRCAKSDMFEDVSQWMCHAVLETKFYMVDYLISISTALIDCTEDEKKQMGGRIRFQMNKIANKINEQSRGILWMYANPIGVRLSNPSFTEGLGIKMEESPEKTAKEWFVLGNKTCVALCRIVGEPADLSETSFERINLLIWFSRGLTINQMISYLPRLSPRLGLENLILRTADTCDREIVFIVNYETETDAKIEAQLKQFSFGFKIAELKNISNEANVFSYETTLTIVHQITNNSVTWITVMIEKSMLQCQLITALIQVSLQVCRVDESAAPQKSSSSSQRKVELPRLSSVTKHFWQKLGSFLSVTSLDPNPYICLA